MKYDFDTPVNRLHTDCIKYDAACDELQRTDFMPLWVADMDFPTPPFVLQAIRKRLEQQILGYTYPTPPYYDSIIHWLDHRFSLPVTREELHYLPGVVPGICYAIQAFSNLGDRVLIQTPVYHPFRHVVEASGRTLVESPLRLCDGRFEMDFSNLERQLPECRIMLLCNPHNPGGTVWNPEELHRLAELCERHHVFVVSDEIHADMTLAPHRHLPYAMVSPEARHHSVTLMAPSKAFNMPGIITSYCFVSDPERQQYFYDYLDRNDITMGNIFSYDCLRACYTPEGEEWLQQMLHYVTDNIRYLSDFLVAHCPLIRPMHTEASFLVFLDHSGMPFQSQQALTSFYLDKAHLYLNDGEMFGQPGHGFMRLNVALPREQLRQALHQLHKAYLTVCP